LIIGEVCRVLGTGNFCFYLWCGYSVQGASLIPLDWAIINLLW
jgi:hypothetical protein